MGIDVSKLRPTPSTLREGQTRVSLSYYAVVDGSGDNPVKLKLSVEPSQPVLFVKDNETTKVLTNQITVSSESPQLYTWDVVIEVRHTPDKPTSCSLRLEATDAHGYKSSVNSFIIYH
jgi:hypothetical protein